LKFFFDQNLPPPAARALSVLYEPGGHVVVHKNDKFPNRSILDDEELLTTLGREGGWVVLTRDRRMRRKRVHYAVLRESGLTAFFLQPAWDRINSLQLSHGLIHRWPDIMELAGSCEPASHFRVPYPSGRIVLIEHRRFDIQTDR
jgi:hypothetical protein